MLIYQSFLIELAVLAISLGVVFHFLKKFKTCRKLFGIIVLPLALFVTGFALRLTGENEKIDLGFFFTDFSFLFVYLIFAVSFALGQIKYWKAE